VYTYLYADFMVKKADRLIAVSAFVAEETCRTYKVDAAKVAIVPHGVDPRFRPMPPIDSDAVLGRLGLVPGFVLAVGNVFPVKNQLTTLRAFARLRDEIKGDLVLAGDTSHPYANAIRHEIARLNLEKRVRLLGYAPPDDIAALMNAASALAFPSLTEGCPVTLLEAMACGLPTVAARSGGLPEIGADAVLYIEDPLDDATLARQMRRLFQDEELRSALVRKSQERAGHFSWRRAAELHLAVYRSCLQQTASKTNAVTARD
jgi:glycosyltransferase involved in cell wall biosynthesis